MHSITLLSRRRESLDRILQPRDWSLRDSILRSITITATKFDIRRLIFTRVKYSTYTIKECLRKNNINIYYMPIC